MTDTTVVPNTLDKPAAPPQPQAKSMSQIAKEMFGGDFKGEVKPIAPTETEEPKPDDTEKGEVPIGEPTEGEQEIAEPEEGEETAPAEDTGETPIATLSELVEHLEAPPEWADTLKVPVTVDGTPTEATISELVNSYQTQQAAEHRLEAAKQIAQKESEVWARKQADLDAKDHIAAELIKQAEAALDREAKAIDPSLRDTDPAEWGARQLEFGQRRASIEQMKNAAVQNYMTRAKARADEFEAHRNQYAAEQGHILLEKLPEWRDEERASTEKVEMVDYLTRQGFVQEELANLIDHRQLLLARKAMLYDKSRGQVDAAKKRVAKVPKIMRPGAPKPREQLARERLEQLRLKSVKTGTVEDAMAYRMAKRGVSQ